MATDPAFPDRPDHPDFWKLSRAVMANDTEVDALPEHERGGRYRDIVARYADLESVIYVAKQRAAMGVRAAKGGTNTEALIRAAWVDGFVTACTAEDIPTAFDGQRRGET